LRKNVEIKAKVDHLGDLRMRVEDLSGSQGQTLIQEDTFFVIPGGRLKLRVCKGEDGQLIYYERGDQAEPALSSYIVSETNDPSALKSILSRVLDVRGVVRKVRELYWIGNTRVHLDEVDGLGSFLELEVVLNPDQGIEEGKATAIALMDRLDIKESDLVKTAYIDLLEVGPAARPVPEAR
jgi:predicted adenylyl cyclase CyaB